MNEGLTWMEIAAGVSVLSGPIDGEEAVDLMARRRSDLGLVTTGYDTADS